MPLTDTLLRNIKPSDKTQRLFDSGGLYLEVAPSGGKWWRLKYRHGGKEKRISLGVYPLIGLKDAREKRDDAKRLLSRGIDPSEDRQRKKAEVAARTGSAFEYVAREWHQKQLPRWSDRHQLRQLQRLERDVFPWIGARPIAEITAPEVLELLRRVESKGHIESAHRVNMLIGQVFKYALADGLTNNNPCATLSEKLSPVATTHRASIKEPRAVGELLRAIDGYQGQLHTKLALRLLALTFVRPGELRYAEWSEFDMERKGWRIPAERMKMRQQHIVPLSAQAIAILEELRPLTGRGRFLFPSERTRERPMSENTINAALRRLGYSKEELTGHGFRSMASTLLNEMGWHGDAVERQLAHAERSKVRAAYNYAEHLPERRKMMQAWADFLDGQKAGGEVIPFRREAQ